MWVRGLGTGGKAADWPAKAKRPPLLGLGTACSSYSSALVGECHLLRSLPQGFKLVVTGEA